MAVSYLNTSPSQITTFELCEARWGFGSILKLPQTQSPEAEYGEKVTHKQQEDYFLSGTLPTHPANRIALTWAELAPPKTPGVEIEQWLSGFKLAGLNVRGRVDYRDLRNRKAPLIIDWKSKGKPNNLKSEYELETDIQLNVYAGELLHKLPEAEAVSVAHGYIARSETQPWAQLVKTSPMPRETVQERLKSFEPVLESMKSAASKPEAEWARNEKACYAFGRLCDFYNRCHGVAEGLEAVDLEPIHTPVPVTGETSMSLKEKLETIKFEKPAKSGAVGIIPPDAPRYDLAKANEKAGIEVRIAPPAKGETTSTGSPSPGTTSGFELYVDCTPVPSPTAVRLEDEIHRRTEVICRNHGTKSLHDKPLDFGKGKDKLADSFRAEPPSGVVLATTGGLSTAVIEVLVPLATKVVRGLR